MRVLSFFIAVCLFVSAGAFAAPGDYSDSPSPEEGPASASDIMVEPEPPPPPEPVKPGAKSVEKPKDDADAETPSDKPADEVRKKPVSESDYEDEKTESVAEPSDESSSDQMFISPSIPARKARPARKKRVSAPAKPAARPAGKARKKAVKVSSSTWTAPEPPVVSTAAKPVAGPVIPSGKTTPPAAVVAVSSKPASASAGAAGKTAVPASAKPAAVSAGTVTASSGTVGVSTAGVQTVSGINAVSTVTAPAPSGPSEEELAALRAKQEAEFREERERVSYEKLILQGDLEETDSGKLPFYTQAIAKWRAKYGKKVKASLFIKRGVIYARQKSWDLAAEDLRQALLASPKSLDAALVLSRIYQLQGKCALAEKEVTRALELSAKGDRAELYYQRALINGVCAKKFDLAFTDFDMAVKYAVPARHAELMRLSFLNRGVLYCLKGNVSEGLADIDEAKIIAGADNRDYLAAMGSCNFMAKRYTAARADYKNYLEDSVPPANNITAEVYGRLGLIEMGSGSDDVALASFNRCLEVPPLRPTLDRPSNENLFDPTDCYLHRGRLYERIDDPAAALQDYNEGCRKGNAAACARRKKLKTPI